MAIRADAPITVTIEGGHGVAKGGSKLLPLKSPSVIKQILAQVLCIEDDLT